MISIISSMASACIILYMFLELTSTQKANPVKYGTTYFVVLLLCVFVPFTGPLWVSGFYLLIALMYRFIYKESYFVCACNTFIMFVIHFVSAMLSSSLVIMLSRKVADFRTVFRTDNVMFLLLFLIMSFLLTYYVKVWLYKLNDYFEQIKDQQSRLIALNVFLIFLLLIYLRLVVESSISIAVIRDVKLEFMMILRLLAGVSVFCWLLFTTNRNLIYASNYNTKSTKILDQVLNKTKLKKSGLSVIYIEIPEYEGIVKKHGVKEGKKIVAAVKAVIKEQISRSYSLQIKQNSILVVIENMEYVLARQDVDRLDKVLHSRIKIGPEGERWFLLGALEYDPIRHGTPQTLILSAQEAAYSNVI
ncbi:MAG: hypothetical protein Q4A41_00505 [Bacillota bacterium]|nr:hypothetical protein [Bacillota bacterium]